MIYGESWDVRCQREDEAEVLYDQALVAYRESYPAAIIDATDEDIEAFMANYDGGYYE